MSQIRITHSVPEAKNTVIDALQQTATSPTENLSRIADLHNSLATGQTDRISTTVSQGAIQATATLTVSSTGSVNNETCIIANVTFTGKTSGATGNQFNISATAATQAANMASAINASSNLTNIVTAAAVLGVVTLTSVVPGKLGNGLQLSEDLTNVALVAFASGSEGTLVSF